MAKLEETYLGDGIYASFDGWYVWLRVDRNGRPEWVGLEPETFATLVEFAERIWGSLNRPNDDNDQPSRN